MGLSEDPSPPEDGQLEVQDNSLRRQVQRFLQAHKSQLGFKSLMDFLPNAVVNLQAAVDSVENILIESSGNVTVRFCAYPGEKPENAAFHLILFNGELANVKMLKLERELGLVLT